MFALSTVGHLAGLTHATPTSLWGGARFTINLVKKEVLKYVPHQWSGSRLQACVCVDE